VEMAGRTRLSDFAYLGLTGILAADDGILGFTAECHRCLGIEVLIMDTLWRSITDSAGCGDGGSPLPDMKVNLTRAIGPAPSEPYPADFLVHNPTAQISGKVFGVHKMMEHAYTGPVVSRRKK